MWVMGVVMEEEEGGEVVAPGAMYGVLGLFLF